MAHISINNGHSFCTVDEALERVAWDEIVMSMDTDIREAIHRNLAPCTNKEFLQAYLDAASENLVIG